MQDPPVPCKNYAVDAPSYPYDHHEHDHAHIDPATVNLTQLKAYEELQGILKTLPARNYKPVVDEVLRRFGQA